MKKILTVIVVLSYLFLIGCDGVNNQQPETNQQGQQSSDVYTADSENTEETIDDAGAEDAVDDNNSEQEKEKILLPDFELTDLEGNTVKLSDFKGKYVFLNFWATWCTYCQKEMPHIEKMYEEYEVSRDEFVFLAVDLGESKEKVKKYIEDNNYSFTVLLDENQTLSEEYYIPGLPTTYFIDKEGYLIGYIPGSLEEQQMEDIIEEILSSY